MYASTLLYSPGHTTAHHFHTPFSYPPQNTFQVQLQQPPPASTRKFSFLSFDPKTTSSAMSYSVAFAGHGADLLRLRPTRRISELRPRKGSASSRITMNSDFREIWKSNGVLSPRVSGSPLEKQIGENEISAPSLKFDRLEPSNEELGDGMVIDFDRYVVREAARDEELWEAAWLRAESQWEDRVNERYAHSYKKKFAEQEFNALRKQCKGHHRLTFKCIVAVNQEHDTKHTAIKSVLGTLDLSIRNLLQGETFPGEKVKAPLFSNNIVGKTNKYAYICNVCVAGAARRQGIASNMMHMAIALTRFNGLTDVYVHVHRKNVAAQGMYQKLGFEMVEMAVSQLSSEQIYLLCLKM